jgi:hypothetical protein
MCKIGDSEGDMSVCHSEKIYSSRIPCTARSTADGIAIDRQEILRMVCDVCVVDTTVHDKLGLSSKKFNSHDLPLESKASAQSNIKNPSNAFKRLSFRTCSGRCLSLISSSLNKHDDRSSLLADFVAFATD